MTKKYIILICFLSIYSFVSAQTPCEDGTASGYPCNQIDLLSSLDNGVLSGVSGVQGNDIWGWTDPSGGKEYVLMGQTNGVVFVDISNPVSPVIKGRLPSQTGNASSWRDIKVYKNHAFVVADNNTGHGMQVFDLSRLRTVNNPDEQFTADAVYTGVSSAHNVVINEETGFAYIVGARGAGNGCGSGGLHIVNIQDPKNPVFAGCFDADGYTHDAQCVIYSGPDEDYQGQEICFNANENTVTIANVQDKETTQLIAKKGYPQSAYSHQGWLTEDQQFFISNDELDEGNSVENTRTLIWDVRNLDNPILINQYFSERVAIDHNLYTKGNLIYQSNYTNGLIILDGSRVSKGDLREVAYFDTYAQGDNTSFNGSWSNYPYFESGVVAISDINNGLFLVKPNIEQIITQHPVFTSCGDEAVLSVGIANGFTATNYQWQTINNGSPEDLSDDSNYSGVNTAELTINPALEGLEEMRFRCKMELENGETIITYLSNEVDGLPSVNFSASINQLVAQFENSTLGGQSFEWDFGDGSEISTEPNPVHTYEMNSGTYEVRLTASNDCGSSEFVYSVNLSQCLPFVDFTVSVEEGEISFINMTRNSSEFEWDFGDGSPIVTDKNPVHTYDSEGPHEVRLTAFNDCGERTATFTIDEAVLSNGNILDAVVKIYPNPVQEELNIRFDTPESVQNISIISADGRKMYDLNTLQNETSIKMAKWNEGIYFLILTNVKGERAVKKIIKK
ncbi:choice-of-anchor B domain-containing protein [Marivirga sericea]|uniref:Choice-of-anchor B domain-containing protein n=1 Tax=Marivirga sericea TaxID=1028 RepID=A0A1X7KHJ2_9BACT|nr:choice-of-anchor B family protein [Marivirga sericea]SMG40391.1 choice-of-anchor B domain-containing protein [Marivirga sericea]